jgi:serine protease Do
MYHLLRLLLICFSINALADNQLANCACQKPLSEVVAPLLTAVVNVSVTAKKSNNQKSLNYYFRGESPLEEFFEKFGVPGLEQEDKEDDTPQVVGAGSGFVIDPSGFIVTNHHVIDDAEKILVKFSSGTELEAKLVGSDSRTDLALLKVNAKEPLSAVKFGNSDTLKVGDSVVSIGNPFGLGGTVTAGIVSATSRDINSGTLVDNFIQTDASVNVGNSGGPLFNTNGEVVGINTAIVSPTGVNIGIAFAIPASFASPIIEQIKTGGKVKRGWLGVLMQPNTKYAESLGVESDDGTMVVSVFKDSPAQKAGIMPGDIILEFDGKKITKDQKLPRLVAETPVGKKVNILLLSKGQKKTINITLAEMDDKTESQISKGAKQDGTITAIKKLLGVSLVGSEEAIRLGARIADDVSGLYVVDVANKSMAKKEGIRKGDVITSINQTPISTIEEFEVVLNAAIKAKRKSVLLTINRKGAMFAVQLQIQSE